MWTSFLIRRVFEKDFVSGKLIFYLNILARSLEYFHWTLGAMSDWIFFFLPANPSWEHLWPCCWRWSGGCRPSWPVERAAAQGSFWSAFWVVMYSPLNIVIRSNPSPINRRPLPLFLVFFWCPYVWTTLAKSWHSLGISRLVCAPSLFEWLWIDRIL